MAHEFISADFRRQQRDKLRNLQQRSGETLRAYLQTAEVLFNEAYTEMPEDQGDLIRDLLSGMEDYGLAKKVAVCQYTTLKQVIDEVMRLNGVGDFLKPRTKGKVHALWETEEEHGDSLMQRIIETITTIFREERKRNKEEIVSAIQQHLPLPKPQQNRSPRTPRLATKDDRCYRCQRNGHFARDCRVNLNPTPEPPKIPARDDRGGPGDDRCRRCRQPGHLARECRTDPPARPCYCGDRHWFYDCPQRHLRNTDSSPRGN